MPNLVTVTKDSRIILKIGGILCGLILVIYIIVSVGTLIRNLFFPKPPPPPVQAFGELPSIKFPPNENPDATYDFTINTVDGQLPVFPDRVNIYKLTQPEPNLLALDDAKNTVDSLNFVDNQTKVSDTLYRWTQARTGIVLDYDIVTKNFKISSNYLSNPSLVSLDMLRRENLIGDFKGYLSNIRANISNFDFDKTNIEYLEIKDGVLVAADNVGSTRIARLTLVPKPIDKIDIVYSNPTDPILTFIASYPDNSFQILDGELVNHIINPDEKSDYPIKSASEALEDLKNGKGYIRNPLNLPNIDITKVELKYYLDRNSDQYLMPIIVFTGTNNFSAFVEAVKTYSPTTNDSSVGKE